MNMITRAAAACQRLARLIGDAGRRMKGQPVSCSGTAPTRERRRARDLILSGREQEVSEIRDFISAVVPDGQTGKPVRGRSDDQTGAAELIRDPMPATLGSEFGAQAPTMPAGLTSLIERTFLHAYFLATLKRDEMIGEGRNVEVDGMVQQARKAQAQALKAAGN